MELERLWEVKDMGKVSRYVGIKVWRNVGDKVMMLEQGTYGREVLEEFGMLGAKIRNTPLPAHTVLMPPGDDEPKTEYAIRSVIGSLLYMAIWTRPDISFAVSHVSQYLENGGERHWAAAMDILRYIGGTVDHGLVFRGGSDMKITGWADSHWGWGQIFREVCRWLFGICGDEFGVMEDQEIKHSGDLKYDG